MPPTAHDAPSATGAPLPRHGGRDPYGVARPRRVLRPSRSVPTSPHLAQLFGTASAPLSLEVLLLEPGEQILVTVTLGYGVRTVEWPRQAVDQAAKSKFIKAKRVLQARSTQCELRVGMLEVR